MATCDTLAGWRRIQPSTKLFAQSLGSDEVVLEATDRALPIARILEPQAAHVLLANLKAIKGLGQAGRSSNVVCGTDYRSLVDVDFVIGNNRRSVAGKTRGVHTAREVGRGSCPIAANTSAIPDHEACQHHSRPERIHGGTS